MAEVYKNSSGPFVQGISKPNQFLRNWLPAEFLLKDKIAQRILPPHLYNSYARWRHDVLLERLVNHISKSLECPLNLRWREVGNNAPKYYDYEASVLTGNKPNNFDTVSYGQSFDSAGEAESRCLGEFLERQFLKKIDITRTIVATKKELGNRAVDIGSMPLYLPWQTEVNNSFITNDTLLESPVTWVKGKSLINKKTRFIPSDRVFWGQYDLRSKSLNQPTSNGNGGGFSYEEAVLSGLYELVERDSFMCHWLLKLPAPIIEMGEGVGERLKTKLQDAKRYAIEVVFLDITTTINVPSALCILFDRHDVNDVKIAVGAAAGYNPNRLLEKSYLEALVVLRRHWFADKRHSDNEKMGKRGMFDNSQFDSEDWEVRLDRYRGSVVEQQMYFLVQQGSKISYPDFYSKSHKNFKSRKEELKYVRRLFTTLSNVMPGLHPYVYRVQDNSNFLASVGFHVVSVVVPQLFPLYLTEHQGTLDIHNLKHWEFTAEAKGNTWTGEVKNLFPHPFP